MNFIADTALATELIAIGVGFAITMWAYRNQGVGIYAAKFISTIIFLSSIMLFSFSLYYNIKMTSKHHIAVDGENLKPQIVPPQKEIKHVKGMKIKNMITHKEGTVPNTTNKNN